MGYNLFMLLIHWLLDLPSIKGFVRETQRAGKRGKGEIFLLFILLEQTWNTVAKVH